MATVPEINASLIPWFTLIQEWMQKADKEGATETFEAIKKKYKETKAILQSNGLNLSGLDIWEL